MKVFNKDGAFIRIRALWFTTSAILTWKSLKWAIERDRNGA